MVMEFYPESEYGGNAANWWVPTLHCLAHMVRIAGFPTVQARQLTTAAPIHVALCRGFVMGSRKTP